MEQAPFARHGSGFTRVFEDLIRWLATKVDKTAICRLPRVDWDTAGRIGERVVGDGLDPGRVDGLVSIGVDEVLYKKNHDYLPLVTDHKAKKFKGARWCCSNARPSSPRTSRPRCCAGSDAAAGPSGGPTDSLKPSARSSSAT